MLLLPGKDSEQLLEKEGTAKQHLLFFPLQALAEAGPGSSGRGTAALPASLLCPHANNSSLGAQKCQEGSSQSQKTPASPPRGYTASKCHIKDKCSRAVCFRRIFVLQKRRLHRGSSQYHNLFLTRVEAGADSATSNSAPKYPLTYYCTSLSTSRIPQHILVWSQSCSFTAKELCIQELELLCCCDILVQQNPSVLKVAAPVTTAHF